MKVREGYYSEQIRNRAFAFVNLSARQEEVIKVIEKYQPITSERIAMHLNRPLHTITPRVLELRQLGVVEYCGEETSCWSGRKCSLWRINPNGTQLSLF